MLSSSPDGMCFARPPSTPAQHQVLEADVGERAAHHDLVVAAARAVRVEVLAARRPWSVRYFAAGLSFAMLPAGEMWSVVIESPSSASSARR
jgi:hypothetical protein